MRRITKCFQTTGSEQFLLQFFSSSYLSRFAVISIDPLGAFSKFTSPWATRQNDEKFFIDTLKAIGGILKDDMKLGTLYSSLVFSTPGHNLSDQTKVS